MTKTNAAKLSTSAALGLADASAAIQTGPVHVQVGAIAQYTARITPMTSEQKQAQGARCPCRGTDDYCPCQNVQQEPRFFLDHGTIHDRVTGKHVITDGQPPFEDGVEQVCKLLNSLSAPIVTWCDLCGRGECLTKLGRCPRQVIQFQPEPSTGSKHG